MGYVDRSSKDRRNPDVETWRPVVGYEGHYEVSDHGRVRSLERTVHRPHSGPYKTVPRVLSQFINKRPEYRRVSLRQPSGAFRKYLVHVLVLEAFIGPRPEGLESCHYDDDPANNHVENLRWGTRRSNTLDRVRLGTHNMARKTHCDNGHELSGANVYEYKGSRRCRTCMNDATRRYREKAKSD